LTSLPIRSINSNGPIGNPLPCDARCQSPRPTPPLQPGSAAPQRSKDGPRDY
jgi:hypothetical protein